MNRKCLTLFYLSQADQKFNVGPSSGWGFCSPSCFPNRSEPDFGLAKRKEVHVMDDAHCQERLGETGSGFEVRPEVICVGFNRSRNVRVYLADDAMENFDHVDPAKDERLRKVAEREQSWYVVGEYICKIT